MRGREKGRGKEREIHRHSDRDREIGSECRKKRGRESTFQYFGSICQVFC